MTRIETREREKLFSEYVVMLGTLRDVRAVAALAADQPGPLGKLLRNIGLEVDATLTLVQP